MTAAAMMSEDEGFDWRTQGVCDPADADLNYLDAEELVEEQGFTPQDAEAFIEEATEISKSICLGCPVRSKCLAAAMANREAYGVWGGKTAAERELYRPAYAKIRRLQGHYVAPTVQKDMSALHFNPGVDARYRARVRNAQDVIDRLRELPETWTLDTRKWLPDDAHYGEHPRQTFIDLFDLIRMHPEARAEDLARGIGKSKSWFNSLSRSCRYELGVGDGHA